MIRLIYGFTLLFEFVLLLLILFLFIITDARTIKLLAKESLASSHFTYEQIEGNFFTGLQLRGLSYNKKPLFDLATVHWNPLTLLDKKITLQEVNVQGIELENILDMVQNFKTTKESEPYHSDFSIVLNNIHLDINPYIFEGVKFSDFLFETDKLALSKEFLIDSYDLHLHFNSDLVRVKMKGKIRKSQLFVERLSLKEIDSREITKLVQRLNKKNRNKKSDKKEKKKSEPFIKKIKIKKIIATMKDVSYSPLSIFKTKILISHGEIDPYNNYNYKVKNISLKGSTNFGTIDYNGYVKDSMIYAKGSLRLSKELFDKYDLPLNYLTLKKLNGTLKLNHYGVWLEIKHSSKELLKIDNDFNLDVLTAKHKLYYDYSDNNLSIISTLKGRMPYADTFYIKNQVSIDKQNGFRYSGTIDIPKVKGLPKEISTYLLEDLNGKFKGNSNDFDSVLESKILEGTFKISDYKNAILKLNSKGKSIELDRLTSALPSELKNEKASLESETFLDFKNFKKSNTTLALISRLLNINLKMDLLKPFNVRFKSTIPYNSILPHLHPDIKFASLSELEGEVSLFSEKYFIHVKGRDLNLSLEYDPLAKIIQEATLLLNNNKFFLSSSAPNLMEIKSQVLDIQQLLKSIKKYYKVTLPKLYGQIDLSVQKNINGSFLIGIKSQNIKYASDKGANSSLINIYDIDTMFTVDNKSNIEIEHYKFRIDENEYMSRFMSDKKSYLSFTDKKLIVKKLWINNQLLFTGAYNFLDAKGKFNLKATQYSYKNQDFDFLVDLNLNATTDKERVKILGDIDIFGNMISYEVIGSDIVEDSDIIIMQELSQEEPVLNNLKLDLKINSKKSLKYISKDMNIEFFNDLRVLKNYNSDIIVIGMTTISKGYYKMEDKYFTLDESHIYFAGDPKKPLLDIKADYKKDEYTIHIFISGSTEEPIVNFTSEPYLTEQEILSLILFDGTGASDGGGAEAYTLLGGTFAKGLIKSLGIDVDHLLLGRDDSDNLSFEIGRKISKDITIIYQHENGKDGVKARIEHNKNFETDIIIQPPNSSSVEFLYKYSK